MSPPTPLQELEQHEHLFQLKFEDQQQRLQLERRRYPRQLKVEHKNQLAELKRANRGKAEIRQVSLLPWQCLIGIECH